MSEGQKGAADTGDISAASASQPDPSPPFLIQNEGLTVIDGGVPDATIRNLSEVDGFKDIFKQHRFNRASLIAAWREQEVDGYPRHTGGIRIKGGTIEVEGDTPMPDDDTVKALMKAYKAANLPKPVTLKHIDVGPAGVDLAAKNVFICHNIAGEIVMIQERYETQDGGKGFIPWTRWDDGEWRQMEPEVMPFYGLSGHADKPTLFLHEGAKSARRVIDMIAGEIPADKFPWFASMRLGHHVGWIGGVHSINRSDWAGIAALGWGRVVIVADNDKKGLKAAQRIARFFGSNVFILMFDQQFPEGHDCGDAWPSGLFDERGHYTGPLMDHCLVPATRATVILPAEGRGRRTIALRDEFASSVAYTADPPRFIFHHSPSRDRSAEEFNMLVAPFSDAKDTATKVLGHLECQHERLTYLPGIPPGTVNQHGVRCFNRHQGPLIQPIPGDTGPWDAFLGHLFPDDVERGHVIRWLATLIGKPSVKMRFGLLLLSVLQGVGKNTLGNVLKQCLGPDNVSFPSQKALVDSQFNSWVAFKRLAFVSELYSGHSRKAYDELKNVMSDDDIEVNEKFVKSHRIDNWVHIIACSNSERALHLDDEDRRWFVPRIAEQTMPPEWWSDFYAWLDGDGIGIILHWAKQTVAQGQYVRTNEHAPPSERKKQIADGSRSEGQQLAHWFAEYFVELGGEQIIRAADVRKWIAIKRGFIRNGLPDLSDKRLEKPTTIQAIIRKNESVTVWADKQRPNFGAVKDAVFMNFRPKEGLAWADLKPLLTTLEGINLDEEM